MGAKREGEREGGRKRKRERDGFKSMYHFIMQIINKYRAQ